MDPNDGLISHVAYYLAQSENDVINVAEFRDMCIACNVDQNSFTQRDLDRLQTKLNQIT